MKRARAVKYNTTEENTIGQNNSPFFSLNLPCLLTIDNNTTTPLWYSKKNKSLIASIECIVFTGDQSMSKLFFYITTLTLSVVIGFTGVRADIEKITIPVKALVCPRCAFGLKEHIKAIKGIAKTSINLGTKQVELYPEKDVFTTPTDLKKLLDDFKKATKLAGLAVGEKIYVQVQGMVEEVTIDEFQLRLHKTHTMSLYKISDTHKAILSNAIKQKKMVEIEGEIHEHKELPFGLSVDKVTPINEIKT